MARQLWNVTIPGIYIEGDGAFLAAAINDLNSLYSRPIGKTLLDTLSKRNRGIGTKIGPDKIVLISKAADVDDTSQLGFHGKKELAKAVPGKMYKMSGGGSGCRVEYDPTIDYSAVLGMNSPTFIVLGHELVHALHGMSGDVIGDYDPSDNSPNAPWKHEEARTVGIGIYANARINENSLRKEHALIRRPDYSGVDMSGLVSALQ